METTEFWRSKPKELGRCHIPGCGALISANMQLCSPHWRLVPVELKRTIDELRRVAPDQALAVATRYVEAYQLIRKTYECSGQSAHRWLFTRHASLKLRPVQMLSTPEGFQHVRGIITASRALS